MSRFNDYNFDPHNNSFDPDDDYDATMATFMGRHFDEDPADEKDEDDEDDSFKYAEAIRKRPHLTGEGVNGETLRTRSLRNMDAARAARNGAFGQSLVGRRFSLKKEPPPETKRTRKQGFNKAMWEILHDYGHSGTGTIVKTSSYGIVVEVDGGKTRTRLCEQKQHTYRNIARFLTFVDLMEADEKGRPTDD
jgi:hypothetical protein